MEQKAESTAHAVSSRRRTGAMIGLALAGSAMVAGCTPDSVDPASEIELEEINADVRNLTFEHTLENGMTVQTRYSTDYEVGQWKITEPKTLNFRLFLISDEPVPEGEPEPYILVEHVHAEVSLEATKPGLDGIPQDSMDDRIHGGNQPGFLVDHDSDYSDVFAIEGFSESLISGWGIQTSEIGASEISQTRLNEDNLADAGVIGNEVSFIYDIVVPDEETGLYIKAGVIVDQFLVTSAAFEEQRAEARREAEANTTQDQP